VVSVVIPCNWAQGVEASIDDAHVAILHASWMKDFRSKRPGVFDPSPPAYDIDPQPYGFRATALRSLPGGDIVASATHFAMPWYGFVSTGAPDDPQFNRRTVFVAVPIDDHNYHQVFFSYDTLRTVDKYFAGVNEYEQDNFAPPLGGPETYWGQDREAMKSGHATGFPSNLIAEDTAVQISMGTITDRTRETLCTSDKAIGYARQLLLQAARDFHAGNTPQSARPGVDFSQIRSRTIEAKPGQDWRELMGARRAPSEPTPAD
jgi:hypothetical protein